MHEPEQPMQVLPQTPSRPALSDQTQVLRQKASALEAAFLAEMLKHAAPTPEPGAFGGGTGEAQFQSFLREEQARLMTAAGGLGLAAHLYRALAQRGPDDAR
jgi:Rod binding domain-containing protein